MYDCKNQFCEKNTMFSLYCYDWDLRFSVCTVQDTGSSFSVFYTQIHLGSGKLYFVQKFFDFLTDFSKSHQFWKKKLTPVLCDIFCGKIKMDYKNVSIWVYQKRSWVKRTLGIK